MGKFGSAQNEETMRWGAALAEGRQNKLDEQTRAMADPSSPTYKGPGWELSTDKTGAVVAMPSSDPYKQLQQLQWEASKATNTKDVAADNPMPQQGTQPVDATLTPTERLQQAQGTLPAYDGANALTSTGARATGKLATTANVGGVNLDGTGTVGGPPAAPEINREQIDKNLGALNTYQNAIWELSQDNTGLSAAEAQLQKATELANLQAAQRTRQSQSAALGQARSARNRGDRALLEQQAVGEAAYIGTQAATDDAIRRAEAEGNLSSLRATEEQADRQFRLDAIKEAANLGLNTSALELDISKANLDSVTNQINNDAALKRLGLELDQRQAESALGYMQAMAALQFQYDQMSVQDRQETQRLLFDKYKIDQTTRVALKQIAAGENFDWSGALVALIGGAGSGATAAIASGASDERVKTNIEEVNATAAELDELMNALGGYTYEYKEPEKHGDGMRFGFMAQELESTKLGKHMVKPNHEGTKMVEIAPLAFATASGLALVNQRLKALEEAVS